MFYSLLMIVAGHAYVVDHKLTATDCRVALIAAYQRDRVHAFRCVRERRR